MAAEKETDESRKRKKSTTKRTARSKEQSKKGNARQNRSLKTTTSVNRAGAVSKEPFPWTVNAINHFIREHAYYLWEKSGNPPGTAFEIWIRAENEILEKIVKKTALRDLKK